MSKKSRVNNLSTRFLELYRYGSIVIAILLLSGLIFYSFDDEVREQIGSKEKLFTTIYPVLVLGFIVYQWLKAHSKVFKVEFDDDYLYIIKRNQDIMIPLENIKNINMKSLGGMWKVDLMYADTIGDHFYFKPSLLYPLNYRSKDELVNLLWRKIEVAKTKKQEFQKNALTS